MATKREGVACYDKAGMDEPLFVLRAQDKLASQVVRDWAFLAEAGGTKPEIVAEARRCADQMDAWPFHKHPGTSIERHTNLADEPFSYVHETLAEDRKLTGLETGE